MSKLAVVIGIGPGNGSALVRRFAADGYRVVAMSRADVSLELVSGIDNVHTMKLDVAKTDVVEQAFTALIAEHGLPDVVLFNAGSGSWGTFDGVTADELRTSWEINTLGLFAVAKQVLPQMRERGSGVLGVTGATASLRGKPFTTAFAQAKAAQRSLSQSFAREFGPHGVHVFYFIVDGVIDLPRTREYMADKPDEFFLKADDIAQSVWAIAHQPRSAWTFELDLRPFGEQW